MKQLTCEMCGSTDLIKQDGFFVCQTCGCKYSVEEAKKMMIEGTVEVQGTVKVDKSNDIENLYQLARRAKENDDFDNMAKYYELILVQRPNDWEAAFYSLLAKTNKCTLAQIEEKLYTFANNLESILSLIYSDENSSTTQKVDKITRCITDALKTCTPMMRAVGDRARMYSDPNQSLNSLKSGRTAIHYCYIKLGDCYCELANSLPDDYKVNVDSNTIITKEYFYTSAIQMYELVALNETEQKWHEIAIERIREIKPDYVVPKSNKKAAGCYVATCVYGSYDCPQVWTLRRYRDDTLALTWYGRAFIKLYYAVSPTLVKWFGHTEWFKKMWKGKLDRMVEKLQNEGVEDTPYEDKEW